MPPVLPPPLQCAMPPAAAAVLAEELEATRQRRKKHGEKAVVAAASSESPRPPATPDSTVEFRAPVTPVTLTSTAVTATKGRKRKKQVAAAASLLVEEALHKEGKKKRKRNNQEAVASATPSPSTPAAAAVAAQISEVAAEGAAVRKGWRRGKLEQGHSGQPPSPVDVHPQGGEAANDGGIGGSKSVRRRSSGKTRVLTDKEILRRNMQSFKEKPLPQGILPPWADPNYIAKGYSTPHGPFFAQFCYIPKRQQSSNAPSLLKTPGPPTRPPPRDDLSILSSQLTTNKAFMVAKTRTSNTKRPPSQEVQKVKEKKRPEKKMIKEKKPQKKSSLLSAAEKRSDKYRRLPLDQLVPPTRSPHKLLQEKYAHDPWKVIVICMMLNRTAGDQVKKIWKGFFKCYPDAQAASTADLEKMAEHMKPLGLQHVKAKRIQRFSKGYVEEEWTYITQLCGVGKYAADAYAIFCAGRAAEVVPQDHKLVDYWKYVHSLELQAEVKKILKGFFKRYPDAQTASTADLEKMAEYLAPLGLKHVKANRIQRFSKGYVEEERNYITELCGVGEYAAHAYEIFCAGRETEVIPEDHKLVDYQNYVWLELLAKQAKQNVPEAAGEQGNFALEVHGITMSA